MSKGIKFSHAEVLQESDLYDLIQSGLVLSEQVESIIGGMNDMTQYLQGEGLDQYESEQDRIMGERVLSDIVSKVNIYLLGSLYAGSIAMNAGGILTPEFEQLNPNRSELRLGNKATGIYLEYDPEENSYSLTI